MGKVKKAFKKVFKGIKKAVKKVVKGVVKLGKKIVKGIGKFVGKLGPIGTIAIAFIAPYALAAMASSSIGWVSAIGQGLQAVSSAVAAPFKALGNAVGGAISQGGSALGNAIGGQIGSGISTITQKVGSFLGYNGGSISENVSNIFGGVKDQFASIGTSASDLSGSTLSSSVSEATKDSVLGSADDFAGMASSSGSTAATEAVKAGTYDAAGNFSIDPSELFSAGKSTAGNLLGLPEDKFVTAGDGTFNEGFLSKEQVGEYAGIPKADDFYGVNPETGTIGKDDGSLLNKALKTAGSLLSNPSMGLGSPTPMIDTSGYALNSAGQGDASGTGGLGTSFWAQDQTGLTPTEQYTQEMIKRMFG